MSDSLIMRNRGPRHVRGDVTQQLKGYRKRCCHAVRRKADSTATVEHVIPRHPHQQRNGIFSLVRSEAISLDHTKYNQLHRND
jgi:hypothetical protein